MSTKLADLKARCPLMQRIMLRLLLFLTQHTKPEKWQGWCEFLAKFIMRFDLKRLSIIRRNLTMCFPGMSPQAVQRLMLDNITAWLVSIFDLCDATRGHKSHFAQLSRVKGLSHFQAALMQDKPIILICPHQTTVNFSVFKLYEICMAEGRAFGFSYRAERQGKTTILDICRHLSGPMAQMLDAKTITKIIRFLKANGVLVMYPDHDLGAKRSCFGNFMGVSVATTAAFAKLANMTDAVCLPMSMRKYKGGFELNIEAPVQFSDSAEISAQWLNDWVAALVRQAPEQYLWAHKRFKTQPPGTPCPYSQPELFDSLR